MDYKSITDVYAACFDRYGPTCKGIDWPNEEEVLLRYSEILKVVSSSVLDFGCGYAGLLSYIKTQGVAMDYIGLDINHNYIEYCRRAFPEVEFVCVDILQEKQSFEVDYVVMNGVLTARYDLSVAEMFSYSRRLIGECFSMCRKGLVVNFTSPYSNKHKHKLFCPSLSEVGDMAVELTDRFSINNSYLPFEQLLCLYK